MALRRVLLNLAILLSLGAQLFAQQAHIPAKVGVALNKVTPDEIRNDIAYLADDKLAGRFPGTPGYQVAIDYVVGRLKALNVKPAGENGTWLQTVRLKNAAVQTEQLAIDFGDGRWQDSTVKNNYLVYPNPVVPHVQLSSSLVFAGYGISAPSEGYDDYAGLDVKGKTVVIIRGAPEKFSSSLAAHVTNSATILKTAAAHGAVGVIIGVSSPANGPLPDLHNGLYSVVDEHGDIVNSPTYYSGQISLLAIINYGLLNRFFQTSGKITDTTLARLKAGATQSFASPAKIQADYSSVYKTITGYNIIGKIQGSDPRLKNEYVVHSAHLDHLGIGKPVLGDSIYNGAHDNASGVASLLGIAKIYKYVKVKPKRSVLLVFVTGEEMGLLGSGYFARHPTVPVKSIVANVNTDMPTIIAPLLSITALGAENSSLINQVNQAAAYLGIAVEPDPEPKQARFTRSDQYSFVVAGIPALHIKYGNKTADGKNDLSDLVAQWRAKYYHQPQDQIDGIFDFEAGKKYAQLNFLIGYLVAQAPARPTWNSGDLFAPK